MIIRSRYTPLRYLARLYPNIVSTNLAIADRGVEMIIALTHDLHHVRKADTKGVDIHGSRAVLTINRLAR